MSTPSYHHGNLRDAIITEALSIIRDDGVSNVSLRAIARKLGVSHAAPARHFSSKDELLSAIALLGFQNLTAEVRKTGEKTDHPVARLRNMGRTFLYWAQDNPALYNAMRHPDVISHADQGLRDQLAQFSKGQAQIVAQAQASGWRPDAPPAAAYLSIFAGLSGFATILTEAVTAGIFQTFDVPAQIEAVLDLWIGPEQTEIN